MRKRDRLDHVRGRPAKHYGAKVVRPSSETNARSPLEAKEAIRAPGEGLAQPGVDCGELGSHCGRVDFSALRQGHDRHQRRGVATGVAVAGGVASFVSQPSLSGTEKPGSSASVAGPAAAMPAIVSTSHQTTTMRLWART
jgi:hypothetical protein